MHSKEAYEQTITSKLEALPVPDMADAIWARIEAQLDLDMPTDDGGGNSPSSPPGGGLIGRAGIFLFVAALVLTFFLYTSRKNRDLVPETTIMNNRLDTIPIINISPPSTELGEEDDEPRNTKETPDATVVPLDSSQNLGAIPLLQFKMDSIQQSTAVVPPPVSLIDDSIPPKRKTGRGVQGLSGEDYRITPKKDPD
jgi:hypothetical protein